MTPGGNPNKNMKKIGVQIGTGQQKNMVGLAAYNRGAGFAARAQTGSSTPI